MIPINKFIPGIAWFFLVLILICLPGDELPRVENWMSAIYFDKWIHVGMFSMLAFLFMMPICKLENSNKKKWLLIIKIALAVCIWGLATELIQKFFIAGRSFDLYDWLADSFGIFLAIIVCRRLYLK